MPGLNKAALLAAGTTVACLLAGTAVAQSAPAPAEGGGGAPVTAKVTLTLHEPRPVSAQMLVKPADGDWLMFRRTLNGWGYSPPGPDHARQRRRPAPGLVPRPAPGLLRGRADRA
ncbi:MAG: hypothetical protein WDN45_05620 [Caulobacteraceae bacterium]